MASNQANTTTSDDQSTTSRTVIETTSTSTQSSTSDQLTTQSSELTSSVDTADTTSKVSEYQTSATHEPTKQLSTIDATTITSVLRSTDVPHEPSLLISKITTADSLTSTLSDIRLSTILSSAITSPTTQASTNFDYSLNTFETQPLTTKETLKADITSLMSALSSSRMATEMSVTATEINQAKSQTNIDLSTNAVTLSITVEDTTKQQSTIDSSTLKNSTIDTINSDSPENNSMTTSKMMYETSPIPTIITNSDESSMGSILSTTTVPPVDSTGTLNSNLSSSLTNPTISTESEATSQFHKTSANLLTTTESHSSSIENLLTNSPADITVTNPITTAFDSTIVSSVHSTSSPIASTSDAMTATQITMSAQSSQFTSTTQTISTTVSILLAQTGPTILPSITTSITPSYSALFVSNSFDNSIDTSSQNPTYAETTTQNRINTVSSSSSNIFTHDVLLSSTQSSQGYSDVERASSYTTQTTSELKMSLDYSSSSKSNESADERTTIEIVHSADSTTFTPNSNEVLEVTTVPFTSSILTLSSHQPSSSLSLDTNPLTIVNTASVTPVVEISTSNILDSVISVSDSSMSQDFSTVTKDRLSTYKILSSVYNPQTTTGPYTNQEKLSTSGTKFDSTNEKINYAAQSFPSSQMTSHDLSSLEFSTPRILGTETSSSETQKPTMNDISSSTHSSPSVLLAETTQSLSDRTDIASSNLIPGTTPPSTLITFFNAALSSQAQPDLDTTVADHSSESTTALSSQTVLRQTTEHFDVKTMSPELTISVSSDATLYKNVKNYTTDKTLTSSLSSEDINEQSTSIILSPTSDVIEQTPIDISKSTDTLMTISTTLNTQTIINTSNMGATAESKPTSTIIDPVSSDSQLISSPSSSFSNDIIFTTNTKQTGEYIRIQLTS
jgi:hypothetical protein